MDQKSMLRLPSGKIAEEIIYKYYERNGHLKRGKMWMIDLADVNLQAEFEEEDWKYFEEISANSPLNVDTSFIDHFLQARDLSELGSLLDETRFMTGERYDRKKDFFRFWVKEAFNSIFYLLDRPFGKVGEGCYDALVWPSIVDKCLGSLDYMLVERYVYLLSETSSLEKIN
jgi:hypothetical protein